MKRLQRIWEKKDAESVFFFLFLMGMALYYGWRLFALAPWYDELYTYYYFISRGPFYAAIHWPLPNNHVGYSVLSAVLDLFGNAAVGLRGVSWLCSLISLCLLFAIGRTCFPKGFALIPVFLFSSMGLVNTLAVQGRGYALATCLYLTALYELIQMIRFHKCQKWRFCILAGAFVWALYTLPSSVYFVVPLCCIGGTWLLLEKRSKVFLALLVTSIFSAVCTVGLYTIIWLAIGSNLLSKNADSGYYGQGHVSIILHAPFRAAQTGIRYMLDTPYIQSVGRSGYLPRLGTWIRSLSGSFYEGYSLLLLVLVGGGILALIWKLFKSREDAGGFLEWYLLLTFLLTPLMLVIQAALPYYRVFSFLGVPIAFLITWLLVQIAGMIPREKLGCGMAAVCGILCVLLLAMPARRAEYSGREAAIADAYGHMDLEDGKIVCVTDCDQEYLMKYLFQTENVSRQIEDADYVLLDKELFLSEEEMRFRDAAGADTWKLYLLQDDVPWDYLEKEMQKCYENNRFILYENTK